MGNDDPTVHWGTTDVDEYIPISTITSPDNSEHPPTYQFEGVDPEDDPTGAYTDEYSTIPDHARHLINKVCLDDWGVSAPREFQVQAIYRAAFQHNAVISIAAKTGYGKSLVILAIASMRRGIAIVLVPLLGLGTDQVAKAIREDKNISAWHVDEFRGPDRRMLRNDALNASDSILALPRSQFCSCLLSH